LKDDALSPPIVADVEGDYEGDIIYAGNLYGSMYRVKNIGKDMEPSVSIFYDSENTADHAHPIRAKADYGYGEGSGEIWIYFGTGRYEAQIDKVNHEQQYFFGMKDTASGTTTYTFSDLEHHTTGYIEDASSGTTETYRYVSGTNTGNNSWSIALDASSPGLIGSERVISQPLVVGGVVFFTTFTPDLDVCAGSGQSWLFAVDYDSGLPPTEAIFDVNLDGVIDENDTVTLPGGSTVFPSAIDIGQGQPSKPVLHKDTMFVTTTGGGLIPVKVNLPGTRASLTSWKDY